MKAFPSELGAEVEQVVRLLVPSRHASMDGFDVSVRGQWLRIPYRIYEDPPSSGAMDDLGEVARGILDCLLTRHHSGYVRQQHVKKVISIDADWGVPFVVTLVGEYVIEIVDVIRMGLTELDTPGTWQRQRYGHFAADNPAFMTLTRQRAASYWSCYHRWRFPKLSHYPGAQVLASLHSAATELQDGRTVATNPPDLPADDVGYRRLPAGRVGEVD
ncbi:hypothetical protein [Streptosporangium saharense]|uniref:Uncharacterized protein n=1 Tax=Streptosporangium saharense TaxID=1706840 RepID=A0A7W7QQ86_9ACTN|nr:hypothetical protein [Streptosporangium saharense]MBB4917762.1 hypothetical protein [Streptosporangium saharense]